MPAAATDPNPVRLVADIGGTNARFALVHGPHGAPQQIQTLATNRFPDIAAAIDHYLADKGTRPFEGAIAIASPVTGDQVRMTNHAWEFSIEATRARLGFDRLLLLNDFTALAMALPTIPSSQREQIGRGQPVEDAPIGLVGPGTGLGVSGLIRSGESRIPLSGEGGHATLSPANPREMEIVQVMWQDYAHVSWERLLSGMGLEHLHRAIAHLDGASPLPLTAAEITQHALTGSDRYCTEAVATFCGMLGSVAGNLALTLGARGGVYIGGGIIPRLGSYFAQSPFRERFESKGRYANYLAAIPTYVVKADNPAFLGAAMALGVRPQA